MAYVVSDRVKETTTTTGTGSLTLAGAVTGFKTFLSGVGNSNTTTYVIVDATGAQWEVGLGTLSGGTTLARTTIYANSAGTTSALNLSAGTKSVFVSMSADVRNFNTSLGTNLGFSPNLYQYTTTIGYGASVSNDFATAVGQYATASGSNGVALGGGTSASNSGATALGQQASSSGNASTAVGQFATASAGGAVAVGYSANAVNSSGAGAVAIGSSAYSNGDGSVALGSNVSASNTNQFSVKMRTDPGGVSGISVLWDSASNEVYATTSGGGGGVTSIIAGTGITITSTGPGGTGAVTINASGGGGGPSWATYQDNDMAGSSLSLATPSATPSGGMVPPLYFFSPAASPNAPWSFTGSPGGGVGATYSNSSYPITSPIGGPSFSGGAVCYYVGQQADAGATGFFTVSTDSSPYSNFSPNLQSSMGWPVFGSTRTGHYIAIIQGSYLGGFSGASGATLAAEFYDANYGYTYFFIDCSASLVSSMSGGSPVGTYGGFTSYLSFFWYTYS